MTRAEQIIEAFKLNKNTRVSKKKRAEAEKSIASAEKEREDWREKTFPKPPFTKRKPEKKWSRH